MGLTSSDLIADLDAALAEYGEDCVLRRVYGSGPNTTQVDVAIKAVIGAYNESELLGGIAETDSKVIMSPSEIARAQWPGGELPSLTVPNPSLPRRNDKILMDGRARNVEMVNPVNIGGVLVRIEMRISG